MCSCRTLNRVSQKQEERGVGAKFEQLINIKDIDDHRKRRRRGQTGRQDRQTGRQVRNEKKKL